MLAMNIPTAVAIRPRRHVRNFLRILTTPLGISLSLVAICAMVQAAWAAVAPPPPDQDAAGWLQALYVAVTSKQWGIVAGVALVGLVYPLRLWGPNVFKTQFGGLVLAFLVSMSGTMGITLAAGAAMSIQVIVAAVTTAATAAGLWEWIKTHLPGGAKAAAAAVVKTQTSAAVSLVVAVLVVVGSTGCAASQRAETLQVAQIAITATANGMLAYDGPHQKELARTGTPDQAEAALKSYRDKRATFDKALNAAVDALIVAVKLNDQPSLDGLKAAIVEVISDYQALKGLKP